MDTIPKLIETAELKTSFLANSVNFKPSLFFNFDKESDILMLLLIPPENETLVHYIDRHVAVLYTPNDFEIVGLQVEDFVSEFMPMYNSLQKSWSIKNTEIKTENVWDFSLAVKEKNIKVAIEIAKAIQPIVGRPATEFEKVL